MYIGRWLGERVRKALKVFPVVVIVGARQVGKTTLMRNLFKGAPYISLDDILTLGRLPGDLKVFIPDADVVLIDEVQRLPKILLAVKSLVDSQPGRKFVLSASASLELLRHVSETLAGRACYLKLRPFTFGETIGRGPNLWKILHGELQDLPETAVRPNTAWEIRRGFMPRAWHLKAEEEVNLWHIGYLNTYIEKDLRLVSRVQNLPDFSRTLIALAERVGNLLKESELARELGIPQPTVHRFLNLLEALYALERTYPYATSKIKSLRRTPKVYLLDTGLVCSMLGLSYPKLGGLFGRLFENLVYAQIVPQAEGRNARVRFLRSDRGEVDFVIESPEGLWLVEAKAKERVGLGDAAFLISALEKLGARRAIIVYNGDSVHELARDVVAVPWYLL